MVRRLILDNKNSILNELNRIGVDKQSYPIFINKSNQLILKIENLSCAQTHILKQTALICGADVAIPKIAYQGGKGRKFSALFFANKREIEKIEKKLDDQPWMEPIRQALQRILAQRHLPVLELGRKKITIERTYIMGVINITPDSFYSGSRYTTKTVLEKITRAMEEEGADFIDIGAESTRPGADVVDEKEEIDRLKRILPKLAKITNIPISIDTRKARVASFAIDHGATIINDISGLGFDKKMAQVVAKHNVCLVIMHMKGTPKTMQLHPSYGDLMGEIHNFFEKKIDFAIQSGVKKERIIIDPGLGFGKKLEDNYEIIRRLHELTIFKRPILVGPSRKSFIGNPFHLSPEQRLEGTLGVEALLIKNGASIIRVHDVVEAKRVALVIDRITR
jgi:dihydropteroate synthase